MNPTKLLTVIISVAGMEASLAARSRTLVELADRLGREHIEVVFRSASGGPDDGVLPEPLVYVSIGGTPSEHADLFAMALDKRRRWLHFEDPTRVSPAQLFHCWFSATEPDPGAPGSGTAGAGVGERPLVSVFTAAYRSGERILRPYRSLLAQTYAHWEWVIVDDGSDDGSFENAIVPLEDGRIRKYRQQRHSGYIGSVKRNAAEIARGDILVELDHDDALTPDCLERLVDAFRRHPQCGFAFGENAEVFEESLQSRWYGLDAGFGFLSYWRQFDAVTGRFLSVARTAHTNGRTLRHLVGLPNHPRAWTREAYARAGGHRRDLSVADDYDLLMRSFLTTRFVRVPHLLYLQYVNADRSNQTIERNAHIQFLCKQLEPYYRARIEARLHELGLPSLDGKEYRRIWDCDADDARLRAADIVDSAGNVRSSRLFVHPFDVGCVDTTSLLECLLECDRAGWVGREVVVVGNVAEGLMEAAARRAPPGRIRWWRTESSWSVESIERYGRLQCSGAEVQVVPTEARAALGAPPRLPLQYREAFAPTAPEDRDRDRLSVLFHLRERFGYTRYLEIGTAADEVFAQMNGFECKIGVDPASGGTHRMTSDAFFADNLARAESDRHRFDLILIDGLHEHEQVLRDVDNALCCLLPGGTIVLHDCMPFDERQHIIPRPRPMSFWTGDVWRAIFALRARNDIDIATGCFDWGVAVLRVRPGSDPFRPPQGRPGDWTWQEYLAGRERGLNLMSYTQLVQWIEAARSR